MFWQVPDALILSLKRRIKHSAWLYMLRIIATFLTNWHITPWQHNTSINRNKLWNSYLMCAIRHCSPACLVHNFRCQCFTVQQALNKYVRKMSLTYDTCAFRVFWDVSHKFHNKKKDFVISLEDFEYFHTLASSTDLWMFLNRRKSLSDDIRNDPSFECVSFTAL